MSSAVAEIQSAAGDVGAAVGAEVGQRPVLPDPPHPVLQAAGFNWGGIDEFNDRIQKVVQAYQQTHGETPPPGLALDVVRSKVQPTDYPSLFQPHGTNPTDASHIATVKAHVQQNPDQWTVTRPDGQTEPNTPTRSLLMADTSGAANARRTQAEHPYIPTGYVPLPPKEAAAFQGAVVDMQKSGATGQLEHGGLTLQQYEAQANQAAQYAGGKIYLSPQQAQAVHSELHTAGQVTTVAQAQRDLQKLAPDFFGSLPVTGYMSTDWGSEYVKWTKSAQYAHTATVSLAQNNGFGSNTGKFIQAWKWQQQVIREHPDEAPLAASLPLSVFALIGPDTWTKGHDLGPLARWITGNTHGWGWLNVPTWTLGSLTHIAGLTVDAFSGSLGSAENYAAAGTAFMQAVSPQSIGGKGQTMEQAHTAWAKAFHENPDIIRVFDPGFHGEGQWWDKAANVAFALVLGLGSLTGDRVEAGDLAKLVKTSGFNARTAWSFNALLKGDTGSAAHALEGGAGAEQLVVAAERLVMDGKMNLTQFRQYTAELWAHGETRIGDIELNKASLMRSLRTRALPTKGFVATRLAAVRDGIKVVADGFEQKLTRDQEIGATNHAVHFIQNARQLFARAEPYGKVYAFNPRAPEDLYNWVVSNLANRGLATEMRSEFVRARATNDVQALASLNDRMRALFMKAHPDAELPPSPFDSKGPQVESESRSYLFFPQSIEKRAGKINHALNRVGRVDREVIVSGSPTPPPLMLPGGGESLAWKHVVDDTLRRLVGGGGKYDPAIFGRLGGAQRAVSEALTRDPRLLREYSAARAQAILGENRWVTGAQYESTTDFTTGDAFGDQGKMTAAGMYLRHRLTSSALKAFQQSTPDDLGPLTTLVLKDKSFRALAFNNEAWQKVTEEVKETYGLAGKDRVKAALDQAALEWANAYAKQLFNTYRGIEKAGEDVGVANPLGEALDVLVGSAGPKADQALGKWIKTNKLDFPVTDPMVIGTKWDSYMQKWIGTLMTANKWNRGKLFDNVFHATVSDLTRNGWKLDQAIPVAADLAQAQTVYHMLDFSNMLQMEQKLRWVAPFMTKHRLYWTWILKQAAARPGLAALTGEVMKHLNANGDVQTDIGGHTYIIPVARLLWANASGYPQTSPLVTGVAGAVKGFWDTQTLNGAVVGMQNAITSTSGNLITRDDQAWNLTVRLGLVSAGKMPATADAVTKGFTQQNTDSFNAAVNEYIEQYFLEHEHWPTEEQAVKATLMAETAHTWWNANLFLPVETPSPATTPPAIKAKLAEYDKLDSAQRYTFLQNNPDVALHFGISQDPAVYLHDQVLWQKYNAVRAVYQAKQKELTGLIETGKYADVKKNWQALNLWFDQQIAAIKVQDAVTWQGNAQIPKGQVSDGLVETPGPWTLQFQGDPMAFRASVAQMFPGIKPGQLDSHTIGKAVADLMARADQLKLAVTPAQAKALGTTVAGAKTQLTEINQIISPFFAMPKNTGSELISLYYTKYVTPYIRQRDKLSAFAANATSDTKTQYESDLRAWKDSHDHPVEVTFQGKKVSFPSVVQIGWIGLPSSQRTAALKTAAGAADWQHVSDYEKRMLGVKVAPDVSKGWAAYATAVTQYESDPSNPSLVAPQRLGLAKQINKVYPGFLQDYLFSLKTKLQRWQYTNLYGRLPDKQAFDQYVVQPAQEIIRAEAGHGHTAYYDKAWRKYVETQVLPWLDKPAQADLKKALAGYGPNFLNTLTSKGGASGG